jgi:hypothetical protein
MNLNSLFQQCLYICIVLIVFTLALNVVCTMWFGLNAVPSEPVMGQQSSNDTQMFEKLKKGGSDITPDNIWLAGVIVGGSVFGLLSIGGSILSKSWNPFAVYLFGMIFWASYSKCLIYLSGTGFNIPGNILSLFTVPIVFLFVGAAIAIYGGQA